jgi:excisionase family DNA binding protein
MHQRTRHFIENRLLTTQELAALLRVPAVTIQKWVERGKVDYVLKGRTYLFDRMDFRKHAPGGGELPASLDSPSTASMRASKISHERQNPKQS